MANNSSQLPFEIGWEDVTLTLFGRIVDGFRGFKYKVSKSKANIHGRGKDPIARAKGKKEYEGSIKLLFREVIALEKAAIQNGGADLTDLDPFDITLVYAENGLVVTHILNNVEVTEYELGMEQGDDFMEVELPISIGKISRQ
jgi:hypothetical protein